MKAVKIGLTWLVMFAAVAGVGYAFWVRLAEEPATAARRGGGPAAVAVGLIERTSIDARREFSATLEASSQFVVSSKVVGRVNEVAVRIGDPVLPGQVLVKLEDAEFRQAVVQAEAELTVARATLAQAASSLEIAEREIQRAERLLERGVQSASQFDEAQVERLTRQGALEVARAQVARHEAQLEAAKIRLGYTRIAAEAGDIEQPRVVAERFVDVGDTVGPNDPLVTVVQVSPILGVIFVAERDYGRLRPGQAVTVRTDAYPGEVFTGEVARIAPVFRQASRQARVELTIANDDGRLKPGMFARVGLTLDTTDDAFVAPADALATRDGRSVVFVVNDDDTVTMHPVTTGVRDRDRVQLVEGPREGRVVTLGQQMLTDGSAVTVVETVDAAAPAAPEPPDQPVPAAAAASPGSPESPAASAGGRS